MFCLAKKSGPAQNNLGPVDRQDIGVLHNFGLTNFSLLSSADFQTNLTSNEKSNER